jgi:hypothetical protein
MRMPEFIAPTAGNNRNFGPHRRQKFGAGGGAAAMVANF